MWYFSDEPLFELYDSYMGRNEEWSIKSSFNLKNNELRKFICRRDQKINYKNNAKEWVFKKR